MSRKNGRDEGEPKGSHHPSETDMPIFDYSEVHLRERCEAVHAAIREGRTALKSIGDMTNQETGARVELYNCPHCKSAIGRKVS